MQSKGVCKVSRVTEMTQHFVSHFRKKGGAND
nr:MAG TPA: hypothetical protein [Caudoviricetes sp.]